MSDRTPGRVIVTGAGRGIGRAVALSLGRAGFRVGALSASHRCEATAAAIVDAGGFAASAVVDLRDTEAVRPAVEELLDRLAPGPTDLVLAAGTLEAAPGGLELGAAAWTDVLLTNLIGNVAVFDAAAGAIKADGSGRVCFLAGGGAAYEYPLFPAYAASKVAVVRTVENIAATWAGESDFAAVAVAPGAVETEMLEAVVAAGGEVRTRTDVREVVDFVQALLSSSSTALSGRFVHVRDPWLDVLRGDVTLDRDHWKLRRVE